jgi:hypothetical protein
MFEVFFFFVFFVFLWCRGSAYLRDWRKMEGEKERERRIALNISPPPPLPQRRSNKKKFSHAVKNAKTQATTSGTLDPL